MKLTAIILLAACMQVSARGYSQITLSEHNAPLQKVFKKIQQQSGYDFVSTYEVIKKAGNITVHVRNVTLQKALEECLKETSLTYTIIEKTVVIKPKQQYSYSSNTEMVAEAVAPPPIEIKGRVINQQGEPLQNASVLIAGTNTGTTTNNDGRFTLTAPDDRNVILEISIVGYQTRKVNIGKQTEVNVVLELAVSDLSDVVVIGYGVQKMRDLTGAISTLKGSDVAQRQTINAADALQGAIPGVSITRLDGRPGVNPTIRIRGVTTIGNSDPLIIIDGAPGNLNTINPSDIDNISVLKDGASASIYGSRAASGVILVTTKRARSGKFELGYSYEYGMRKPTRTPKYVGAVDFMTFINERNWNDAGNTGSEFPTYAEDHIKNYPSLHNQDPELYPDTDYSTYFSEFALSQRHLLSLSGGTEKVRSLLSMSYSDNGEFSDNQLFKTFTVRSNTDIVFNKILTSHVDLFYENSQDEREQGYGMINLLRRPPLGVPFWNDGRAASNNYYSADMARSKIGGDINTWNNSFHGRLSLELKPLNGLTFTGMVRPGISFYKSKNHNKQVPLYRLNDDNVAGYATGGATTKVTETRNDSYSLLTQFLINYSTVIAENHSLDLLAGYENTYSHSENLTASRDQYILDNYPYLDLGPLSLRDNSGSAGEAAMRSFYGRLSYSYNNKYLAQFSLRNDGSSGFAKEYRWGLFPSVSLGWILSKESFLEDVHALSFLKLRGSYGTLGNDRIGAYSYMSTVAFGNSLLYSGSTATSFQTAYLPRYAVRDISWETTKSWDVGLDVNFFNNSLQITADYFKKNTTGMLLALEIPRYVGLDNPNQNAGEMHTSGWEFAANYSNAIGNLNYRVSANIYDSRSIMGNLKGTEFLGSQIKREGSEFNEWYGYKTDGLFQTQEEIDKSVPLRSNTKPGDIKYLDLSGPNGVPDGIINQYDLTLLGGSLPRYQYGGTVGIEYKGFDLTAIFQGIGKRKSYLDQQMVIPDHYGVADFVYGKTWSKYNDAETNKQAFFPIGGELGRSSNYLTSDYWLFDGSYFRLKNIIIGYSLPKQVIRKLGIKDFRLSLNFSDLFSVDHFPPGYDPEQGDGRGYFITKAYIFSAAVKF
ncbi:MAG: TonB-dependent receptor [Chitinophagaceae bacterium]|nr:TonB-dependent receptor [Chitinophagaceae bacterium]